ncbi:MAG: rhomboid family intramembrane serine protease [Nitrososphaerota archaeon]|nr:rhomboid family intramembrane serine protease [Nitrososphaerota archaeon]
MGGVHLGYDGSSRRLNWAEIRPGWILALFIFLGWLVGVAGDAVTICPPSLSTSFCDTATNYLAQNNGLVVYYHTYWQIFSSTLVTDSILDAAFNALAVLILDRFIEGSFNKSRYFLVFILTATLGNVLTLLEGPMYLSAGASGGIFGLFAATFSYSWAAERKIDGPTLGFFLVLFVGSSFILPNINWVAHLGGALGGFAAGPLLYRSVKERAIRFENVSTSKLSTNVSSILFIGLIVLLSATQFFLFAWR